MSILYNLGIRFYALLIDFAALFNTKARLFRRGRKGWRIQLKQAFALNTKPVVWIHVASLGEFEQGRPVIETFREKYPDFAILLTFFSPSGYEIRKDYDQADWVFYLPIDSPANARFFINTVKPELVIFVKYEFWYNYLKTLYGLKIKTILISAIFRPRQLFFRWYGGWYRRMLNFYDAFFVQNKESLLLLEQINITNATIAGDTRFDRVATLLEKRREIAQIPVFAAENQLLVIGSSWPKDEDLLIRYINQCQLPVKFIFAPHEIHESHILQIESKLKRNSVRYSDIDSDLHKAGVLIIDNIGMLSSLYAYGQVAYIGGGFGSGIHNILEAATYGMPMVFGTNYSRFQEAVDLIEQGAAFSVNNYEMLERILNELFINSDKQAQAGQEAKRYVRAQLGSTRIIMDYVQTVL